MKRLAQLIEVGADVGEQRAQEIRVPTKLQTGESVRRLPNVDRVRGD